MLQAAGCGQDGRAQGGRVAWGTQEQTPESSQAGQAPPQGQRGTVATCWCERSGNHGHSSLDREADGHRAAR